MQRPQRPGDVERSALEGELGDVPLDEGDVRGRLHLSPRDQLEDELDGNDLPDERGECKGESAGPGAGVERPLVACERRELAHAARQLAGALLLELRDPVSRRCESRPHCVVRTQAPPLSL